MTVLSNIHFSLIIISTIAACGIRSKTHLADRTLEETVKPLPLQTGAFKECGIEKYEQKSDSTCEPIYYEKQSSNCEEDYIVSKADLSCPGSKPRRERKQDWTCDGSPHWEAIEQRIKIPAKCHRGDCEPAVYAMWYRCFHPEELQTCTKREFGVVYKSCRNINHGKEGNGFCDDHSKPIFNTCSIYIKHHEIPIFIQSNAPMVEFMGQTMVNARGNFYALNQNSNGIACTIKKFNDPILYGEIISQLKLLYATTAGENYEPNRDYDCDSTDSNQSVDDFSCSLQDNSRKCKTWRTYKGAKTWLLVKSTDVKNILSSDISRMDAQLINDLETLKSSLELTRVEP